MGHSSVKIVTLYQERNLPHLSLPRSPFYKNDRSSETLAKRQFNPLKPIKYSSPRQNAALYSRADLSRERVTKSHRFAIFSAFALRVLFCSGWKGKGRKKEKRNKIKGEKRRKKEWSRNILTRADTKRSNGTIEKRFARRERSYDSFFPLRSFSIFFSLPYRATSGLIACIYITLSFIYSAGCYWNGLPYH